MPGNGTEQRKLTAIMFTDMVGYSALAQRNEALALELLEEHRRLLRPIFPQFNGREVETAGDAFLVEFASALEATRCAVEIQRVLSEYNQVQPDERHIRLRIGIHVGDVVHKDGKVMGDAVNIAARIYPLAPAGGVCVSNAVYEQVRNKLGQGFANLGPAELKNIELPMAIHRVVMPWDMSSSGRRASAHSQHGKESQSRLTSAAIKWGLTAALVLLAAGLGWWLVHQASQEAKQAAHAPTNAPPPTAAATSATNQKSIAVLPFVLMSADKADEYLSDGMTEELLNMLAQVPGLRVPGRSSCFAFKGKTEESIFRKVGEQLRVTTVLEGSVRKAGNKLRITVQLINVADGFHLWSQTYDREMKDILTVQTEVAQQVVQALQLKLGVEAARALARNPTENPEAHRLYLLGRHQFGKATQAGWTNGIHYFNQAIQLDPAYALAYCGLADIYGWMGGYVMPGKEAWAKEKELAQKALAIDPNLADAHLSLGLALAAAFDWQGGEKEMKRAIELNSNLALAYDQYAWLLCCFGRYDEAIAMQKKALELDPLSPLINNDLSQWLYFARRYDEAIVQCRRTLELYPTDSWAHFYLAACRT